MSLARASLAWGHPPHTSGGLHPARRVLRFEWVVNSSRAAFWCFLADPVMHIPNAFAAKPYDAIISLLARRQPSAPVGPRRPPRRPPSAPSVPVGTCRHLLAPVAAPVSTLRHPSAPVARHPSAPVVTCRSVREARGKFSMTSDSLPPYPPCEEVAVLPPLPPYPPPVEVNI